MNKKEINEDFDREYERYSREHKEGFVKLKMPTYYIAKHSDEDLRAAVLAEREACAELLNDWSKVNWNIWDCIKAIRVRGDEMKDGIALASIAHPEGNPVPDDHEINPDSLETVEIRMPVMPEDQLETWMHNMIRACNRSTCDSDINVLKLIQHIENLYEAGRRDEREACVKLLEDFSKTGMVPVKDTWRMGLIAGANAIRGRTELKSEFKTQMDDNWAGLI
jgi:hypothetical protein